MEAPATQFPPEKGGVENVDPECVVLEVVTWPLEEIRNVDVSRSAEEPIAFESDLVQDCGEQHASESEQSMEHIPFPVIKFFFLKGLFPHPGGLTEQMLVCILTYVMSQVQHLSFTRS